MSARNSINVLILGSGGREHAIAWKVQKSDLLKNLYVAPGNSGTSKIATNIAIDISNYNQIKHIIQKHGINLLIIGPEDPLVNGLHDRLISDKAISKLIVIGPKEKGAMLEGSKSFAKKFMLKNNIPTAHFKTFEARNFETAIEYIKTQTPPFVIKADGLAAGKGVFICNELKEAVQVIKDISINNKFGSAGNKIVIEEFLIGLELSVFIITDGNNYKILPVAKDYKRIGDGDIGLNTGGMGAVSPVPFADLTFIQKVNKQIIEPTLKGLKSEKIDYTGFIFFGLINVEGEPFVIEYNVRLGDPETQAIMPRIESDLLELFLSINNPDEFEKIALDINQLFATTVVLTAGGYPEKYKKRELINGLDEATESIVFHAGIKQENDTLLTNGGRVLAVTSLAKTLDKAIEISYNSIKKIEFKDCYFRNDVGNDLI